MSTPPFALWAAAADDATFTDPAACAARASEFERQIARRNRRERIAGWAQLPLWGLLAAFFAYVGEWPVALALALTGAGVLVVIRNLPRHAGLLERRPEEPCLDHLVRQYRRQYRALIRVPLWYVGPLVPGLVAVLATVTAGVAETKGWNAALAGLARPTLLTGGVIAAVILVNLWAARRVKRELDRLERLA
ncbi:hypothetical protein [Porphyrobacter sp. YT40]|uniref:hypothetical protein n=1 Tax=Porphyrobacter sp. YT40 TaxID=2547601 RepID=UPI0015E89030|nr:hypothetical protein [Porphyrobacter sp. YT40]